MLLVDGTRTVIGGRVDYPWFTLDMTDEKRRRLQELAMNRAKWNAYGALNYSMTLGQNCFMCLYGAAGPNRIVVKEGAIVSVRYQGESLNGPHRNQSLMRERSVLKTTIEEMFEGLQTTITRMTSNTNLRVVYDSEYGFPSRIDFDRPDIEDEQYSLIVSDFRLR
jgi:hypothetical protein